MATDTATHDLSPRLLGSSGLRVSPLTLGTMTFGDGAWRAGEDETRAIFHRYLEAGGNSVDTADVYGGGRSEELLGALIAEAGVRDSLVLATKASAPTHPEDPNARGNGRKHLISALEGSLRRLRTDSVDVFWLHFWDGITPVAEVVSTLDSMVRAGKARAIGLSNVPAWYASSAASLAHHHGLEPPAALQLEYSLLERTAETEHVPAAQHHRMSLVPWSPLASGFLTGKYTRESINAATGGRLSADADYPDRREHDEHDWRVLDAVINAAERLGCTPAQTALAWVMRQPAVATTIIGATSVAQLETNLAATAIELDHEAHSALNIASRRPAGSPYRLFTTGRP